MFRIKEHLAVALLLGLVMNGCGGGGNGSNGRPDNPTNLIINLYANPTSPGTIELSWNSVGSDRLYWIYMDDWLVESVYRLYPESPVVARIDRLMPLSRHCFKVVAYTSSPFFYVGESSVVCVSTPEDRTPPSEPAHLRAAADGLSSVSLTWSEANDDSWIAGYRIYRDGLVLQETLETFLVDDDPDPDTLHCYRVSALDAAANESAEGPEACAALARPARIADLGYPIAVVGFDGRTSLALDLDENVHISYLDNTSKTLFYATDSSAGWSITMIDTAVYGSPALVVDAAGTVHLCYTGDGIYSLKYATNATGNWVIRTVDADWAGKHPALAVDAAGKVHISYYDHQRGILKHATNISGAWQTEEIESGILESFSSIAVDSQGTVHVSYNDRQTQNLKYADNATGAWDIRTIDDSGAVDGCPSLALDATDQAHIAYFDTTRRVLRYLTKGSGAWVSGDIHAGGDAGAGSEASLALDSEGGVHIVFDGWGYAELWYTTNVSGQWRAYPINPGPAGAGSLKLDAAGRAHISSHQATQITYSVYSF